MIKKWLVSFAAACALTTSVVADLGPGDYYLMFETWGDDCYADGSALLEGECYALVWRKGTAATSIDGLFNADGTVVDPSSTKIVAVFPAAVLYAGGTAYAQQSLGKIDRTDMLKWDQEGGVMSLFVLDTRKWNEQNQVWELSGCNVEAKTVAGIRGYGLVTDLEDIEIGVGTGIFVWGTGPSEKDPPTFDLWDTYGLSGDQTVFWSGTTTPAVGVTDQIVTFDAQEGSSVAATMRKVGSTFGELPRPEGQPGRVFVGWFMGDKRVLSTTPVTGDVTLTGRWADDDGRVPLFSSLSIANGKAFLSVTNTSPNLWYDISSVTNLIEAFGKPSWLNAEKQGLGDDPLTWEIDLKGEPKGFFRVLPR